MPPGASPTPRRLGRRTNRHTKRKGLVLDDIQQILDRSDESARDKFAREFDQTRMRFHDDELEDSFLQFRYGQVLPLHRAFAGVQVTGFIYYVLEDTVFFPYASDLRLTARVGSFIISSLFFTVKVWLINNPKHILYVFPRMYLFETVCIFNLLATLNAYDNFSNYLDERLEQGDDPGDFRRWEASYALLILVSLSLNLLRVTFRLVMLAFSISFVFLVLTYLVIVNRDDIRGLTNVLLMLVVVVPIVILARHREIETRFAFFQRQQLDLETETRQRMLHTMDALLRSTLPVTIAQALKASETPDVAISEQYQNASVIFVDFHRLQDAGPMSMQLMISAIRWLDGLASSFDVEKIKSIGTIWMGVSGPPYDDSRSSALSVVSFALAVTEAIKAFSASHEGVAPQIFQLRIGIAQGSLVAGVISAGRLTFDVFGECVNLGSRLCSNNPKHVEHPIHVSETVRKTIDELAPGAVSFASQEVVLKGLGVVKTALIVEQEPDLLVGSVSSTILDTDAIQRSRSLTGSSALPSVTQKSDIESEDSEWANQERYSEKTALHRSRFEWQFTDKEIAAEFGDTHAEELLDESPQTMRAVLAFHLCFGAMELSLDETGSQLTIAGIRLVSALLAVGLYWLISANHVQLWQRCALATLPIAFFAVSLVHMDGVDHMDDFSRIGLVLMYEVFAMPTIVAVLLNDKFWVTVAIACTIPWLALVVVGHSVSDTAFMTLPIISASVIAAYQRREAMVAFLLTQRLVRVRNTVDKCTKRAEALLYRTFPAAVLESLKRGDAGSASYEGSVVVSDLSGFTAMSKHVEPAALVRFIEAVFKEFDAAAAKLGCENLKTIGDSWVAAVGVPEPRNDHYTVACSLGLEMVAALRKVPPPKGVRGRLGVRVGVASGTGIIGAIVGTSRIAFDVFGPVPRAAALLEAAAMPDSVHVASAEDARRAGFESVEGLPDGSGLIRPKASGGDS